MFSNLGQNSILYVLDFNGPNRVLCGTVEGVSLPRPKYASFNPNREMVVDIIATINGERREFKGVPNGSVADFGNDTFILAESKDAFTSYVTAMLQNSKSIINSVEKHQQLAVKYEEALQEVNPSVKADKEKDKVIQSLQDQVNSLQGSVQQMLAILTKGEAPKTT